MKYLMISLAILGWIPARTQYKNNDCVEVPSYFSANVSYLSGKQENGFQFEMGKTGSESNLSYFVTLTGFPNPKYYTDEAHSHNKYPEFTLGGKLMYRFVRAPGILSVYATTLTGMDMVDGWYNAEGIRFTGVVGQRFGINLEPTYLTRQKVLVTQIGLTVILE